ncbi:MULTISPECIES: Lrp/AsnC family transcriptional regulator [Amycolatopsis]|uniref:Lrp/AsnC family transcriptional regulator n=1 Tax=Amycolatopsis thermalba TaxID=944492 RepID=A0ABY4P4B4_9PSEU|nr:MULTISPECIES: Lrp/AsnC family transcriptional regulator [Amycolatopsis]OXM73145.1 AsnC family transcriptional regulator [Amycolatopsis sp. KNN50.9b]UQS27172.1 Lrp/AsnC family transcriptional regulator [Amycolatopsis thermalba]
MIYQIGQCDQEDAVDSLDARLLLLLTDSPRLNVLECARRLGVARGTVQARLDRLTEQGILGGFPPELNLAAMGYGLTAFAVLEIAQGRRAAVSEALDAIEEVCEVHATTGQGDLFVRMVARDHDDLQRVIDAVVNVPGVRRTSTSLALSTPVPPRVRPLLERLAYETNSR